MPVQGAAAHHSSRNKEAELALYVSPTEPLGYKEAAWASMRCYLVKIVTRKLRLGMIFGQLRSVSASQDEALWHYACVEFLGHVIFVVSSIIAVKLSKIA